MKLVRIALLLIAATSLSACFRYTVITGAPPADKTIDLPWQKSFVFGLVPPDTVKSLQACPKGVSSVVIEHSFLNMLVAGLTWNLFTPMHPTVTCASGPVPR